MNNEWSEALLAFSAVGHFFQIADRKKLGELLHLTQRQVATLLTKEETLKRQLEKLKKEYESLRTKALSLEDLNDALNKRVQELEKKAATKTGKAL